MPGLVCFAHGGEERGDIRAVSSADFSFSRSCMQHTRPLQNHPEFTVREYQGCTEFRVESRPLSRNGISRKLRLQGWSLLDPLVALLPAMFWQQVCVMLGRAYKISMYAQIVASRLYTVLCIFSAVLYAHSKCTQVLWGEDGLISH